MPDYRETLIRLSHDTQTAEVWTESAALARKLTRRGFAEIGRQGRGVWLKGHARQISFRNPGAVRGSGATRAVPEGLRRHRESVAAAGRGSA